MPIHDWTRAPSGIFHHFHQRWIAALCDAFNLGGLPRGYFALAEQVASGPIPDVLTLQQQAHALPPDDNGGGLAIATAPPNTRFVTSAQPEQYATKANHIAIYHPLGHIVAVLGIVSPGNKDSRHALRAFVEKAVGLLNRGINLLIVDLFPPTPRDPHGIHKVIWDEILEESFDLPADKQLTLVSYSAGTRKTAYIEPVAVGDQLPDMPMFLEPGQHVLTRLEETYAATWSVCPQPMRRLLDSRER
jgi:hypothetical protein